MLAVRLANIVHATDVGMSDLARDADLIAEPRQPKDIRGQAMRQKFQSDRLAKLKIIRPIHLAHATLAEQPDDTIAPGPKRSGGQTLLSGIGSCSRW